MEIVRGTGCSSVMCKKVHINLIYIYRCVFVQYFYTIWFNSCKIPFFNRDHILCVFHGHQHFMFYSCHIIRNILFCFHVLTQYIEYDSQILAIYPGEQVYFYNYLFPGKNSIFDLSEMFFKAEFRPVLICQAKQKRYTQQYYDKY